MKKSILLLMVLLFGSISVNAVDWQWVDTNLKGLELYIDKDSVQFLNDEECYYAIKYKTVDKPVKIAYIKSNIKTGKIGIIEAGDFEAEKYRPKAVFDGVHVFMKPLDENSFLSYANNYAFYGIELASGKPTLRNSEENIVAVSYKTNGTVEIREYIEVLAQELEENWNPPVSAHNTEADIIVSIGSDGSLQNYKFVKSSGDETTDRSIISAIEKTVPFSRLPKDCGDITNVQFTFDYDLIRKSVK